MKIAKNRKHRRVRAASKATTALKRVYKKPSVQTTDRQSSLGELVTKFIEALTAPGEEAKTIRLTKIDEHHEIETRDYSCQCGRPECLNPSVFMTMVFRDKLPITPMLKATTLEEVDKVHRAAKRRIEQGVALEQVEAEKELSHAMGNCECRGKDRPKA